MGFSKTKSNLNTFRVIFCILANFICFGICYYFSLPIRMEHVGSLYAAVAVGIGPGIFVAIVCQLIYALFYFGFSNILFILPIIAVMAFAVFADHCTWLDTIISSLGSMCIAILINLICFMLISMLIGRNFIGHSCWLEIYDTLAASLPYDRWKCTFFSVGGFTAVNSVCSWIVAILAYRLTPRPSALGLKR